MTVGTASKLDMDKFRKVCGLMEGGATNGERAAAKDRATAMAKRAGLSLVEALSKLRTSPQASAARPKAQTWEEHWAEMKPERDARWEAAVEKHGPAEAVFAETEMEKKLRIVLGPFETYKKYTNTAELYVDGYIGYGGPSNNPEAFARLMDKLVPLPTTLAGLLAEWQSWEDLIDLRCEYDQNIDCPVHVRARRDVLERLIDHMPATSWDDLFVRIAWRERCARVDRWSSIEDDLAALARLKADIELLRATETPPDHASDVLHGEARAQTGHAQFEHRTNADKADAVRSMLRSHPELSNREIGRRAGVSPQTVGTWRSKLGSGAHG